MSIGGIGDLTGAISSSIDSVTKGVAKALATGGLSVIPDAMQAIGSAVKTAFDEAATLAGAQPNLGAPGHVEQPQDFYGKAGKHSGPSWMEDLARALGNAEMKIGENVKTLSEKVGQEVEVDKSKQATAPKGTPKQGASSSNIDVETQKLKRMIDKRSLMFDILRPIIDKYNETQKGMIQSLPR